MRDMVCPSRRQSRRRRRIVGQGLARRARFEVKKLLYYDTKNLEAGLLLEDNGTARPARLYHLYWDLRRNRIRRADVLGARSRTTRWVDVKALGYDPRRRLAYLQVVERVRGPGARPARRVRSASRRGASGTRAPRSRRAAERAYWGKRRLRVRVVAAGRKGVRTVARFHTRRRVTRRGCLDPRRRQALVVEYGEGRRARPRGHLVSLRTGRVRSLPIPRVTYGAAFSPDGKALLLYGAKPGVLQRFDLTAWKVERQRSMRSYGHALGFPFPDTLLVLRHQALHLIDPVTLRERQRIPTSQFYRGHSQIQGSVVSAGGLWLKNSGTRPRLHRIQLTRRVLPPAPRD